MINKIIQPTPKRYYEKNDHYSGLIAFVYRRVL